MSKKHDGKLASYDYALTALTPWSGLFRDKVVYCNDDDIDGGIPQFFLRHFDRLKLSALYVSNGDDGGIYYKHAGDDPADPPYKRLEKKSSYDDEVPLEYLAEADIVISQPLHSHVSKYMAFMADSGKPYLCLTMAGSKKLERIKKLLNAGAMRIWGDKHKATFDIGGGDTVREPVLWLTNIFPKPE